MTPSLRATITALLVGCLVTGCVRSTTITYLPSPEQPRLTMEEGREMLVRFIGVECDRLVEAGRGSGSADLLVQVDSTGLASSAELVSGSGDERANGIMGAVAAQLQLDAADAGRHVPLRASYACDAGAAGAAGAAARLERR